MDFILYNRNDVSVALEWLVGHCRQTKVEIFKGMLPLPGSFILFRNDCREIDHESKLKTKFESGLASWC
jgi:hypothetical protein